MNRIGFFEVKGLHAAAGANYTVFKKTGPFVISSWNESLRFIYYSLLILL